jgi:hypothetical protein
MSAWLQRSDLIAARVAEAGLRGIDGSLLARGA